jgi:hypothetical protein
MFLGALIAFFLEKKAPKFNDMYTIPIGIRFDRRRKYYGRGLIAGLDCISVFCKRRQDK